MSDSFIKQFEILCSLWTSNFEATCEPQVVILNLWLSESSGVARSCRALVRTLFVNHTNCEASGLVLSWNCPETNPFKIRLFVKVEWSSIDRFISDPVQCELHTFSSFGQRNRIPNTCVSFPFSRLSRWFPGDYFELKFIPIIWLNLMAGLVFVNSKFVFWSKERFAKFPFEYQHTKTFEVLTTSR